MWLIWTAIKSCDGVDFCYIVEVASEQCQKEASYSHLWKKEVPISSLLCNIRIEKCFIVTYVYFEVIDLLFVFCVSSSLYPTCRLWKCDLIAVNWELNFRMLPVLLFWLLTKCLLLYLDCLGFCSMWEYYSHLA